MARAPVSSGDISGGRIAETGSKEFQRMDRIRLEVALVDNHELYAWHGSRHFDEEPIYNLVGAGVIGTGEYGLFAQTVFLSGSAKFRFAGQDEVNGRHADRFLYEVPRALSRYEIRLPAARDTVGFGGSACRGPQPDLVFWLS
jgi:hypothetical protein